MYYFVTIINKATREIVSTTLHGFEEDAHDHAQRAGRGEGYSVFITSGDPLS